MLLSGNSIVKIVKCEIPRCYNDAPSEKMGADFKFEIIKEKTDKTPNSTERDLKCHTLTAPTVTDEKKSNKMKLPKISRQARTAPASKHENNDPRLAFTAPALKLAATPLNSKTTYSENKLPPITGYYKDHYMPPTLKLCKQCQHFWKYFRTQEITFMAAVAGDVVDLYDVRKTQRRLKVLINVNDVDTPQRYPIRRRPLPQGACYVCSHLDLDGRYQHPHAYLFRKGFFNKCSHHPKTPYPTLIESGEGDHPEDVFNFNKQLSDEELKLSVSVRVKSRPGRNSQSPIPIFGQTHFNTSVLNGVQLESHVGDSSKFNLPSIFSDVDKHVSGQTSLRSSWNSRKSEQKSQHNSRQSMSSSRNQHWNNHIGAPSRRSEENFKINPTISDRSWLEADGYLRKDVSDDEGDEEDHEKTVSQLRPKSFGGSEEEKPTDQSTSTRPQSENISPASSRMSRPKGAKRSSDFGDEEGHLKYHHRSDNESLPHDGFSIASRENSNQTPIRSRLNSKLSDPELALIGSQISRRSSEDGERERLLSHSSSSFILQRLTGGLANHWCSCQDIDYSKVKCEECLKIGDHEKWCVHARSTSRQGNCPHCGKPIMKTSKRASNMSFRSSQQLSVGKQSQQSEEKHVKFEDAREEILINHGKFFDNKVSDKDDDEVGSADSDDVWTATEEIYEGGIDPNIHKRAYLKALFELRMSKLSKISELDESWILDRISKPTFSYFKLRPGQEKAFPDGPKNIGLTPDNAHLPPLRKSMKHIFGKIKVDDFYPGGKKNPRVTVTVKREKKQQTMPVHSYDKTSV